MTDKTLPLLFVNLGGEMLYIIEDRLINQDIEPEKTKKVLHDIVATMLNERFVEELFKPQKLSNRHALRTLFDNLAHVSIMRLNRTSMDKLYDLMVSVVKYQIFSVLRPQDLLLVTMNHIEALAGKDPTNLITKLIANFHTKFVQTYAAMQSGELQLLRNTILNFLQDETVRVSVLLKDKSQHPDGKFVIPTSGPVAAGCEVPIIIRNFTEDGILESQKTVPTPFHFTQSLGAGSLGLNKPHVTQLGLNIYHPVSPSSPEAALSSLQQAEAFDPDTLLPAETTPDCWDKSVGYKELSLLATLLRPSQPQPPLESCSTNFLLDLFPTSESDASNDYSSHTAFSNNDEPGCPQHRAPTSPALVVDARNQQKADELEELYREMNLFSKNREGQRDENQDLLDLLPS